MASLLRKRNKPSPDSDKFESRLPPVIVSPPSAAEVGLNPVLKVPQSAEQAADLMARAGNASICFLVDTTGSMSTYIDAVKDQILAIVSQMVREGCEFGGVAFVGYKDWCDGANHFEILEFTKDVNAFKAFVAGVRAGGGGDFPEDVLGGLDKAINITWPERSGARIIFHLADAPPHGTPLYHSHHSDDFPNGHQRDRPLVELFKEMKCKEIAYHFGRVNNQCDRMIAVFSRSGHYGEPIETFDIAATREVSVAERFTPSVVMSITRSVERSRSSATASIRASGYSGVALVTPGTCPTIPEVR
jgi:von Willebrand factor type A domain